MIPFPLPGWWGDYEGHTEVEHAIVFATLAHAGQRDKAWEPYILHPLRVMLAMPADDKFAKVVAVLHDVVEDTEVTRDDIDWQFGRRTMEAIDALTRWVDEDESYSQYLYRVAAHPVARRVKIADLRDNLRPAPDGGPVLSTKHRQRYENALAFLEGS